MGNTIVWLLFWLVMKSLSLAPATRGAPKVYKSAIVPLLRISAAARVAIAPPKLCPTTTTLEDGWAAAVLRRAARIPVRASTQESQNPWWAVQPGQISVGTGMISKSASQFRTETEPRKARIVRPRVRSTATYPVTSVKKELVQYLWAHFFGNDFGSDEANSIVAYFSNSYVVITSDESTSGQFPALHVSFGPPAATSLFPGQ